MCIVIIYANTSERDLISNTFYLFHSSCNHIFLSLRRLYHIIFVLSIPYFLDVTRLNTYRKVSTSGGHLLLNSDIRDAYPRTARHCPTIRKGKYSIPISTLFFAFAWQSRRKSRFQCRHRQWRCVLRQSQSCQWMKAVSGFGRRSWNTFRFRSANHSAGKFLYSSLFEQIPAGQTPKVKQRISLATEAEHIRLKLLFLADNRLVTMRSQHSVWNPATCGS